MKLEDIKNRIDELIQKSKQLIASANYSSNGIGQIDPSVFTGLKTASLSLILKIYDKNHPYYTEIEKVKYYHYSSSAKELQNVLICIKEEVTGGWLFNIKGIVSAEIFADFMEMAEHLIVENFKDPAAVMIGGVLEGHLRQLCIKQYIAIEITKDDKVIAKKADLLNSELATTSVYNKLDQKNITAWLDLRNKAAHGKYEEYSKAQVELMYAGIMDFLTRNPI